jgi:seryl-tRNA synthetase
MTYKENLIQKIATLAEEVGKLEKKRDNLDRELERKVLRLKNLKHTLDNLPVEVGNKEVTRKDKDQD